MSLDYRLANWGRVVREGRAGPAATGSIEGAWRSPQPWDEPVHAMNAPLTATDRADGWKVEAAWATLSPYNRAILRSHYCWRTHYQSAILRSSTRRNSDGYMAGLSEAQGAIGLALERTEGENRNIVRSWVKKTLALVGGKYYKHFTADSP